MIHTHVGPRLYRFTYCLVSLISSRHSQAGLNIIHYQPLSPLKNFHPKPLPSHISKHLKHQWLQVVWWNWLDLLIVLSGFAEMLLPFLVSGPSPLHLSGLRGLRLLRLARVARGLTLGCVLRGFFWDWAKEGKRWEMWEMPAPLLHFCIALFLESFWWGPQRFWRLTTLDSSFAEEAVAHCGGFWSQLDTEQVLWD